ncbi:alpha-amylase family glycosyl hydrolase [Lederbergia wuyishanensis]|uniref:Glycosidase n=1 Tax=Lederbergia wuyishanensis TaxID=1347903 RepID=A0ABU0DA29_9BACI|nr:alpha-amylase family glycosyl hydrolase [Lederbergia wuyishanensis]MCJ8009932.1 alpha-amylase family glycosyl hydrolase [Lederbergia wuyishanensis]MDQ0345279.1 glycosidase [Lederbergia wuyishanensis]
MKVTREEELLTLVNSGLTCKFNLQTGQLLSITSQTMEWITGGLLINVGCDEEYKLGRLKYHSLDPLHTWEMPPIDPLKSASTEWEFTGYSTHLQELHMEYKIDDLEITVIYHINGDTLEIGTKVKNTRSNIRLINGLAFMISESITSRDIRFEFPGNVPHNEFRVSELSPYKPVVTGLVNPIIRTVSDKGNLNILFINEEEKWSSGVYIDDSEHAHFVNIACLESYIKSGETIYCGKLYIQPVEQNNSFLPIRELYKKKGWNPPTDGHTEGVLYSCHPHGTMDSGFQDRKTMREYAEEMVNLKQMGIDHVWILPIFEHLDRGVYHPTDQRIIDTRYGTDEDVEYFSEKLHDLGMTLLFDYVPHGPELDDPLGIEHREWASVWRDGTPKIEWNCLSFDMANPDYQKYTTELVEEHVDRFDIDGARIDCAMGGLSNWNPVEGKRPSSSSLGAGVSISKAIRDGILNRNKKPIVTPENFNPVPVYAPYTDIFYDMPLYRVLFELEESKLEANEYASRLTRWLNHQMLTTPENYLKLRFLGNHDSVTWVWQKARPTVIYGVEKAKALWVLMATIDGIPMIYQGDEDASIYRQDGPVLRDFFTELFAARKEYLGNTFDVEYLFTETPIMAFVRTRGDAKRLVVVNLSPDQEQCTVNYEMKKTLFGQEQSAGNQIKLDSYGYAIIEL